MGCGSACAGARTDGRAELAARASVVLIWLALGGDSDSRHDSNTAWAAVPTAGRALRAAPVVVAAVLVLRLASGPGEGTAR